MHDRVDGGSGAEQEGLERDAALVPGVGVVLRLEAPRPGVHDEQSQLLHLPLRQADEAVAPPPLDALGLGQSESSLRVGLLTEAKDGLQLGQHGRTGPERLQGRLPPPVEVYPRPDGEVTLARLSDGLAALERQVRAVGDPRHVGDEGAVDERLCRRGGSARHPGPGEGVRQPLPLVRIWGFGAGREQATRVEFVGPRIAAASSPGFDVVIDCVVELVDAVVRHGAPAKVVQAGVVIMTVLQSRRPGLVVHWQRRGRI